MPTHQAEPYHAEDVEDALHERGFDHLRARKYGNAVIVESGPKVDPVKHMRLRRDTVHLWYLDFAKHTGKWEKTPFRATIDELLEMVTTQFPWTIADVFGNPERTSDREH